MSSVQNVNFQGKVPENEKRKITICSLVGAPLVAVTDIMGNAIVDKSLRKDTFVNTAKASVASHMKDYRVVAWGLCEKLGMKNWADALKNLKNTDKRLCAAVFTLETLGFFGLLKFAGNLGLKFNHRKDN